MLLNTGVLTSVSKRHFFFFLEGSVDFVAELQWKDLDEFISSEIYVRDFFSICDL